MTPYHDEKVDHSGEQDRAVDSHEPATAQVFYDK
jgi:hypothetical protein